MKFLKKLVGMFGFGHEVVRNEEEGDDVDNREIGSGTGSSDGVNQQQRFRETGLPRRGFGVPVQVAVERTTNLAPLLQPCVSGDAPIQGLKWYTKRLRVDEDGDAADEFLEEVSTNAEEDNNSISILQSNRKTKPAKVKGLVVSSDGRKLQQCIEHQGRFLLV